MIVMIYDSMAMNFSHRVWVSDLGIGVWFVGWLVVSSLSTLKFSQKFLTSDNLVLCVRMHQCHND